MYVLNIAVRVFVLLVGAAILGGVTPFSGLGSPLQEVFGSIVVLFGVFRIVTFYYQRKHQHDE